MKQKIICAILTALLLTTGCAQQQSPVSSQSVVPPSQTQAGTEIPTMAAMPEEAPDAPISENNVEVLRIGTIYGNDVFSLTSQADNYGRMNYNAFCQAPFVVMNEYNEVQPFFFRSWEISPDGKEITFTIPDNAVWHDGVPVTAEDVIFTFEYCRDVRKIGSFLTLQSVEARDATTIHAVFGSSIIYRMLRNGAPTTYIMPKHIWENVEEPSSYAEPDAAIGCGPFKYIRADKDAQISYYESVGKNYFAGEITIDKIELHSFDSWETMVMALRSDNVDALYNYSSSVDANLIPLLLNDSNINIGQSQNTGNYQLIFGMENGATSDLEFRKALTLAFDYELLGQTIGGSYAQTPGLGIIAPPNKGFDESLPLHTYDIDAAMAILDAAGYIDVDGNGFRKTPDGDEINLIIIPHRSTSIQELYMRISEVLQQNLKAIGINSTIETECLSNADIWEAKLTDGEYNLFPSYCTYGVASYDTCARYIIGTVEIEGSFKWGQCNIPEYLEAFYELERATDDEEYVKLVNTLQRIHAEELPAIALTWNHVFIPYRTDRLENWVIFPGAGPINPKTWFTLTNKS